MIANLIIIIFVLGMAYIWSVYGFFSAFLQLILVIAAGAVALAVWEPLVLGFLMARIPHYAWGIGLLGPFVLILMVMRGISDVLVRKNVIFPKLIDTIGGACCGLLAGILMAGITWIGLNFLPFGASIGGVQPYRITNGQIEKADSTLWFGVDRMAARFYNGLSGGAFHTSTPLRLYQPDLAWEAAVYRLHGTDDNASLVATPECVEVSKLHAKDTPIAGLPSAVFETLGPQQLNKAGHRLLIVDTRWTKGSGTYDQDSAVRIAPTQVRLVTFSGSQHHRKAKFYPPLAYSRILDYETGQRHYEPFNRADADVRSNQQSDVFGFIFMVPTDEDAQYVLIRHLRLNLPIPAAEEDDATLMQVLGNPAPPPAEESQGTVEGEAGPTESANAPATGGSGLELTSQLPQPFNRNAASSLSYQDNAITSGNATASGAPGGKRLRVDSIYVPPHMAAVRLLLTSDQAHGIFGHALAQARSTGGIWLLNERNQPIEPFAYVWQKGDEQELSVDPLNTIHSAANLPISRMGPGDKLYLYFQVPKPTTIAKYHVGNDDVPVNPPLEIK